jgi:hypothetical protein
MKPLNEMTIEELQKAYDENLLPSDLTQSQFSALWNHAMDKAAMENRQELEAAGLFR